MSAQDAPGGFTPNPAALGLIVFPISRQPFVNVFAEVFALLERILARDATKRARKLADYALISALPGAGLLLTPHLLAALALAVPHVLTANVC